MSATPEGVLPAESVDAALTWFRAACMKEGASPGDTVYHQSSREMRAVVDAAIAAHVAARVGEERERWVKAANARRSEEFVFLCTGDYKLGYRDALGELLEDLEEYTPEAR
jgi:hypothetical protein